MTVYVDQLRTIRGRQWCHMMTDQDDLTELHNMAHHIGLKRSWFQDHILHPHYDLAASKRRAAIKCGAVAVMGHELVERCSRYFKDGE